MDQPFPLLSVSGLEANQERSPRSSVSMAPTVSVAPLMPSRSFPSRKESPREVPSSCARNASGSNEPLSFSHASRGATPAICRVEAVEVDRGQQVAAGAAGDVVAHQGQGVDRTAVVRDPVEPQQAGAGLRPGLVNQLEVWRSERRIELPGGGEELCRGRERGERRIEVAGAGLGVEVEEKRDSAGQAQDQAAGDQYCRFGGSHSCWFRGYRLPRLQDFAKGSFIWTQMTFT